jgi:hypothetical protein
VVLYIELMPGITGMIHHDLSCHCQISLGFSSHPIYPSKLRAA